MRRRFTTRDRGLSARLAVALALMAALYLAAAAVLVAVCASSAREGDPVTAVSAAVSLLFLPGFVWAQYAFSGAATIRTVRARAEPAGDTLVPELERLAALADVRPPGVLVAHSWAPNALAVTTRGRPIVIVTTELLRRLSAREQSAVVAHELTHLANRDSAVMAFVGMPAIVFAGMWHGEDWRGRFVAVVASPVWLVALLLMRSVSRSREFAADRGSALLTGEPEQLMSALTKLAGKPPRGDLRGGAAVSALCIVGAHGVARRLLEDHPPLERRLAHLAAIAREMGRPAA